MTYLPPTPEAQVQFLRTLQRLLAEGSFVASYKFALLHSLADLAVTLGDDTGAPLTLTTSQIAERFIELYWRQVCPYPGAQEPLQQNTGKQAAVVRVIEKLREEANGSLGRAKLDASAWSATVAEVGRVVKQMPLWKLQTVGEERLDFLYDNLDKGSVITLKPGVAFCLRAFYGLATELVRSAWLRYVRSQNSKVLGDESDLSGFLFGTERADLSAYADLLRELQSDECFYCEGALRRTGAVDHFVPWVRYPVDLGHNFVLTHVGCNSSKSDTLAAVVHLERWCQRNDEHAAYLKQAFDEHGLTHHLPTTLQVIQWSYSQAESVGSKLWLAAQEDLVPMVPSWRALMGVAPRRASP